MRIISIHVYKTGNEPILLAQTFELGFASIFERGTLKEFINFHSRLVVARTPKDERLEITLEKGICYSYVTTDQIGISIICDNEYPRRVAFDLIYKIIEAFNQFIYSNKLNIQSINTDTDLKFKYLDTMISEWQNPKDSKFV